jgi:outer membrane protein assembly factor BamB
VLPVDNQEHHIYMSSGTVNPTAYWKFNWNGEIVSSWDSPFPRLSYFEGTLGARDGVVYIYSGSFGTLFAVNETTMEQVWNTTGIVTLSSPYSYSNNPIEWNEDNSILYIPTANQIHAINAKTGQIIWSTQPTSGRTYYTPLIRSTLDNTFVVKFYNNTLAKYNIMNGQLVWSRGLSGGNWVTTPPPTVDNSDGSIYVTNYGLYMYKLDIDGNVIWTKIHGGFDYHSPVLFDSEWLLALPTSNGMTLHNKSSGEMITVFNYAYHNGAQMQMFCQPLFNKEKNVLYIVYYETGAMVALDTSNKFSFTVLWSLDTPMVGYRGGGPSIAADGTIFLANTHPTVPVALVSIGCPARKQVSSDGLSCVCLPDFVPSGDSCVCGDANQEPSEDEVRCVDIPVPSVAPINDTPSAPFNSNASTPVDTSTPTQTPKSVTSSAVIGPNMFLRGVVLIAVLLMLRCRQ